jgi:6-pyruvoyltetrahydropterin/6-carboxytetrahydropterin synthase
MSEQIRVTISRRYDFEAAHRLPFVPDGHKCKRMHGHSYVVHVRVTGVAQDTGDEAGMIVDFGVLDAAARALHERVDHTTLNESFHPNPTVENMAPLVWVHFRDALDRHQHGTGCQLRVTLREGPRSECTYPPEAF